MGYQVPNSAGSLPCPRCGSTNVKPVKFSWWGGALGPRIISLVRCESCKLQYKGKTGESAKQFIIGYTVVVGIISLVVFALFAMVMV